MIVPQNELSPERLIGLLSDLDREKLAKMAEKAKAKAAPQAASDVAKIVIDCAN